MSRTDELGFMLRRRPDRCPGCGWHLPTMGHQPHCPLGLRSNVAVHPGPPTSMLHGHPVRLTHNGRIIQRHLTSDAEGRPVVRPWP